MQPGRFTELFFLDEATAFAAGHRPCALCRREDYDRFVAIWGGLHPGQHGADPIDAQLHDERIDPHTREQRRHEASLDELPDGTFLLHRGSPFLVLDTDLLRWTPGGYAERVPRRPRTPVETLTPPSLVAVLRHGWTGALPLLHPSAFDAV